MISNNNWEIPIILINDIERDIYSDNMRLNELTVKENILFSLLEGKKPISKIAEELYGDPYRVGNISKVLKELQGDEKEGKERFIECEECEEKKHKTGRSGLCCFIVQDFDVFRELAGIFLSKPGLSLLDTVFISSNYVSQTFESKFMDYIENNLVLILPRKKFGKAKPPIKGGKSGISLKQTIPIFHPILTEEDKMKLLTILQISPRALKKAIRESIGKKEIDEGKVVEIPSDDETISLIKQKSKGWIDNLTTQLFLDIQEDSSLLRPSYKYSKFIDVFRDRIKDGKIQHIIEIKIA